ncbi:MAG: hypothetical protein J0I98_21545 [Mesorhizobium sp.]|nr:hypothetical protein [Mesorhizobium sp.]MBN9245367.1 hypothetical protein [Mesorhizobium sp.]
MPKTQAAFANRARLVDEIVTEATVDALNHALSEHDIDADRVISVLLLPAQPTGVPQAEKFRVLFRAA